MDFDFDRALLRFSELLKCKTISGNDAEFERFRVKLKELYPHIAQICEFELIGGTGLFFLWRGKNAAKSIVLMSHYDVVPAEAEQWEKPPFSGEILNGEIWGRGAVDTKCSLCAVMESVETLISHDFTPECDVYMCFGGDEETSGDSAKAIVAELELRGVKPFLVLDEGGAVIKTKIAGIKVPCALVGIAEKGYMNVEFIARGKGGHTSLPSKSNPIVTISEAVLKLKKAFKPVISEPSRIMINSVSKHIGFKFRQVLKSSFILKMFLGKFAENVPEIGALTQTIGAITLIDGGNALNVIPEQVRAVGNFRVISGSSVNETLEIIKKALQGLEIEVNLINGSEPSKISRVSGEGWSVLNTAISETWGECAVVPYLMVAGSDSRFYSSISDNIYRFSPMIMTEAERSSIHGVNEKISEENFKSMIQFYISLLNPYNIFKNP
ncbi:MAG: M20/M25/M40 family metallo-hydrolase [Oscillospiraceae bacterium]|nr:M20/M25/M40 family metallo-hydrolase [Oscillospiraceae bacterium]